MSTKKQIAAGKKNWAKGRLVSVLGALMNAQMYAPPPHFKLYSDTIKSVSFLIEHWEDKHESS